jgi:hypothetical protein
MPVGVALGFANGTDAVASASGPGVGVGVGVDPPGLQTGWHPVWPTDEHGLGEGGMIGNPWLRAFCTPENTSITAIMQAATIPMRWTIFIITVL